ncbi:MAG: insulinase family protein [Alphaproteobacteria bacterium]|nr:MAG: insulinase family protein [Alphaproteobacteria bacterium]
MVKTFTLPNGITCVCEERPQTGRVAMQVFIDKGAGHETPEENGLTNLMQESCFGGTSKRSREQIAEEVESKGGGVGSETSRLHTSFKGIALTRYTEETFAVLADLIRNPILDAAEIERAKAQIAQNLKAAAQEPEAETAKKFMETAFSGQAFGADPEGEIALLSSFTPLQVKKKHTELLADPSSIVISFSGDIDPEAAKKLAQDYFGDIPKSTPAPQLQPQFTAGDYREPSENDRLNLFIGFPAPGAKDDDRYAVMMMQNLLAGGMSTPLFQELREKRSLVYTPGAPYIATPGEGTFGIMAGTGEGKAGELLQVTLDIFSKIAHEGFDKQAMDEARERILRSFTEARETAMKSGALNAVQIMEKGRVVPIEEFEKRLKQVTNDDIRRVCIDMLKDGKYALSAVGPQESLPTGQEIRGMMEKAVDGAERPSERHAAARLMEAFTGVSSAPEKTKAEPKITVLPNGLTIITVERPGPLSCGAWVGVGSDNETPELNGATHMNEHMMFKGTPEYAPGEIDSLVEGELGAKLNAYTTKDKTCYYFYNLLPSAMEKVVDICGQMVFFASIDEGEYAGRGQINGKEAIKGEREAVLEEMRMCNDDVGNAMMDLFAAQAYPDQPHGRSIIGTKPVLLDISAKQLRDYRDEFYAPNNVIFCATGPVKHEDVVAAVTAKYGDLKPSKFPPLPAPVWHGGTAFAETRKATICNVVIGAEAVARTHPDSYAYDAVGALLADGDSSILHKEIVDRQQLSPKVEAGVEGYRHCGAFVVIASAEGENVKPLVNAMYKGLRDLAENVTEADLAKAKATMEMNILAGMEANGAACNKYAVEAQAFGRLVLPSEISDGIQKMTVDDIRRVAKKILDCNPAASMIVPPGTDKNLLPTQEEVMAMRDGNWTPPAAAPKPQGPSVSPSAP